MVIAESVGTFKKSEGKPETGVGVCLLRDGKVLLGKRKNSHGDGSWSFPGGHLEMYESWEKCAEREVLEETGLRLKNPVFAGVTNDIFIQEKKHYITIFIKAEYDSGQLELREPEKCSEWKWFPWDDLPELLFLPIINLIKQGYRP
jgi:8-oxo-dGTP diphosphatase